MAKGCAILYVAGCSHCEGCYNVKTWSFNAAYLIPQSEEQIKADLAQPYVQGLTLLSVESHSLNTGIFCLVKRILKELPERYLVLTGHLGRNDVGARLTNWLLLLIDILSRWSLWQKQGTMSSFVALPINEPSIQKSLQSGVVIWDKLTMAKLWTGQERMKKKRVNKRLVSEIESGKVKRCISMVIIGNQLLLKN